MRCVLNVIGGCKGTTERENLMTISRKPLEGLMGPLLLEIFKNFMSCLDILCQNQI